MKLLMTIFFVFSFSSHFHAQKLIKKESEQKIELNNNNKIFSSNAGYCKIYKLSDNLFVLHNGYSEVKRKTVINRENLDEMIRASKMILKADQKDIVELETLPMQIRKGRAVGDIYWFEVFNTSKTIDFEFLTLEEANQLLYSSDINSVTSNGEKVVDKLNVIESEIKESFMSLSKGQLKKFIALKY